MIQSVNFYENEADVSELLKESMDLEEKVWRN